MGIVILVLILALILGGVGLVVEALQWLLWIALIMLVVSLVLGVVRRGAAGAP
jgi:hypothetical protein